jgi:hypothetical protein
MDADCLKSGRIANATQVSNSIEVHHAVAHVAAVLPSVADAAHQIAHHRLRPQNPRACDENGFDLVRVAHPQPSKQIAARLLDPIRQARDNKSHTNEGAIANIGTTKNIPL